MIDIIKVSTGVYGWCTRLFPREFKREYKEELQGVFTSLVKDSVRRGGMWGLIKICGRELRDLPGNILHEHLAEMRKRFGRNPIPGAVSPWRSAGKGALGWGIGLVLMILLRWRFDPSNDLEFRNFGLGLLLEGVLFGMAGALGWLVLGRALSPDTRLKRLVFSGLFFGVVGGLVGSLFVWNSYQFVDTHLDLPSSFFGYLISFLCSLIYGACFGVPIVFEPGFRQRSTSLVLCAAIFMGIGWLCGEAIFHLYGLLNMSYEWRLQYWGIPLAVSAEVHGLVAGALFGWVVGRKKPRQPDSETSKPSTGSSMQPSGSQRFTINSLI